MIIVSRVLAVFFPTLTHAWIDLVSNTIFHKASKMKTLLFSFSEVREIWGDLGREGGAERRGPGKRPGRREKTRVMQGRDTRPAFGVLTQWSLFYFHSKRSAWVSIYVCFHLTVAKLRWSQVSGHWQVVWAEEEGTQEGTAGVLLTEELSVFLWRKLVPVCHDTFRLKCSPCKRSMPFLLKERNYHLLQNI